MTLYIIAENTTVVRPLLNSICQFVNLNDFFILDPKHDTIDKPYQYLLQVGPHKFIEQPQAFKTWQLPVAPSKDMDPNTKKRVVEFFKKIKAYVDQNREKLHKITPGDTPPIKDLREYLNEKQGQVVQVRLPDQRSIGIYPDNNKLKGEYDVEYHASTIVNMSHIMGVFNATEVTIKEV